MSAGNFSLQTTMKIFDFYKMCFSIKNHDIQYYKITLQYFVMNFVIIWELKLRIENLKIMKFVFVEQKKKNYKIKLNWFFEQHQRTNVKIFRFVLSKFLLDFWRTERKKKKKLNEHRKRKKERKKRRWRLIIVECEFSQS